MLLPDQVGADHRPQDRPGPRRRRRLIHAAGGGDAGDRRRIGLRQDDADPQRSCDWSTPPSGAIRFRGAGHHPARPQASSSPIRRRDADGLPGSAGVAEPAQAGRPDPGDAAAASGACRKDKSRGREPRLLSSVGLHAGAPEPLPARVLRRPAPADRDRPRAGGRSAADPARRAGVGARRVDPGPGDQPAR